MESVKTKPKSNLLMDVIPPIADAAAALIMLIWLQEISLHLVEPSGWNALLLVLFYLLFCIGVYLSRKLLPQPEVGRWAPPSWLMRPKVRGVLGLIFALFMATTFAYQLGYFEAIYHIRAGLLEEGSTAAFFVYAPGAWIGFSMLVILVLAFPVDSNVPPGNKRYALLALISLVFANSLLVFISAQTRAVIAGFGLLPGIALWLVVLTAIMVSFLPARAIYQSRQPNLSGWLSFLILLILATYLAVFS